MAYLAQYTIRSKQAYIFRTNSLREITGASAIIRDAWDELLKAAEDSGIPCVSAEDGIPFSLEHAFDNGTMMVELFRGGGNETILFKDRDAYRKVNAAFTRRLLESSPGMVTLCAAVEATDDYMWDYGQLMAELQREKNGMNAVSGFTMMPFSLMDRNTFQPIVAVLERSGELREVSAESKAKLIKADRDSRITEDNKWLDDLVKDDEEKSLLAVVHADGNNMGKKIPGYLGDQREYNVCVEKMRKFVKATARAFTGDSGNEPKAVMDSLAKEKGWNVRWVVSDGDDATFICDAKGALELTECYLRAVSEQKNADLCDAKGRVFRFSSCAGICIFHRHYPFAAAYEMAEAACEKAKKPVHQSEGQNVKDEAWIDFHYIHSGLNGDLDTLRKRQGTAAAMARPWAVVSSSEDEIVSVEKIKETVSILQQAEVSRSRIKKLGTEVENRVAHAMEELLLMYYKIPGLEKKLRTIWGDNSTILKVFYDLSEVYDLWFRKEND